MQRRDHRPHVAIYGNTRIPRVFCASCGGYSFVLQGLLACCESVPSEKSVGFKVIVKPTRRRPTPAVQEKILLRQGGRCLYCSRLFGDVVVRDGRRIVLKISWDHFVPFSIALDNTDENFVASCHVCNTIKRDRIFQDVEECSIWLKRKWFKLGYEDISLSRLRCEDEA